MSSAPWLDGPADCFPSSYLLACTSTQQYQRLSKYDGAIQDFFTQSSGVDERWLWHTFAKPVKGMEREQHYCPEPVADTAQLSRLEQLPVEMVDAIMELLIEDGERGSVLTLGLASPILYPNILSRIHREYANHCVAPWAGKKVGFLGGDSPVVPSLVKAHEEDFFEYITFAVESWPTREEYEEICISPETTWREGLREASCRWPRMEVSTRKDVSEDLSSDYMYPRDRVWVLRNLTTRQYVRDDGLTPPERILEDELLLDEAGTRLLFNKGSELYDAAKPGEDFLRAQVLKPFTLPQIFLILTAHSGHPGWREEDVGFGWGPWVNHAFEVVPLEDHGGAVEWEDVTVEVAADVGHLRWCVMQRAALARSGGDRPWEEARNFRERAVKARARWTRWAKHEKDKI